MLKQWFTENKRAFLLVCLSLSCAACVSKGDDSPEETSPMDMSRGSDDDLREQSMDMDVPPSCEEGASRCGDGGVREVCLDGLGYTEEPCPVGEVCHGDGACGVPCEIDPSVPCEVRTFTSSNPENEPGCFGERLTASSDGWVVIGDPCANPSPDPEVAPSGVITFAKLEDGLLVYQHAYLRRLIGEGWQLGSSLAIYGQHLFAGAPGSGYEGEVLFIPEYRKTSRQEDTCPVLDPDFYRLSHSSSAGLSALTSGRVLLWYDPLSGTSGNKEGSGAGWVLEVPGYKCSERMRYLTSASSFENDTGWQLGSAMAGFHRNVNSVDQFGVYIGNPGVRGGKGGVNYVTILRDERGGFDFFDERFFGEELPVKSFGKRIIVSPAKDRVFISAPDSDLQEHQIATEPTFIGDGFAGFLPTDTLDLPGYKLGEQMTDGRRGVWVLATPKEEDSQLLPALVEFAKESDGSFRVARVIRAESLGLDLDADARFGASLERVGDVLLVGAPGAGDGGQVIVLRFAP